MEDNRDAQLLDSKQKSDFKSAQVTRPDAPPQCVLHSLADKLPVGLAVLTHLSTPPHWWEKSFLKRIEDQAGKISHEGARMMSFDLCRFMSIRGYLLSPG
jgi:hypothetical protein